MIVSAKDREHFRRIAEVETELNREAVCESARRSPGENIALGFDLSEFAVAFGADLARPDEIAPASLWRQRLSHRPGQQ